MSDVIETTETLSPEERLAQLKKLIDAGLDFGEALPAFAERQSEDELRYISGAREHHHVEGEVEFDDHPIVSLGSDPGAYVLGWVWVTNDEAGISDEDETDPDEDDPADYECETHQAPLLDNGSAFECGFGCAYNDLDDAVFRENTEAEPTKTHKENA